MRQFSLTEQPCRDGSTASRRMFMVYMHVNGDTAHRQVQRVAGTKTQCLKTKD